jgi:hypothetical protein
LGLAEKDIHIPRWYHATKPAAFPAICQSQQIEVRCGFYRGAWVSTNREPTFGSYVFAFTDSLSTVDLTPSIPYSQSDRRWRGLQKNISLEKGSFERVACISIPNQADKKAQKKEKLQMLKKLTDGSKNRAWAFTTNQLDFIQGEVVACLGHPNLDEGWWSS